MSATVPVDSAAMETIDFYFSFRSPYAWLAFHRIDRVLTGLPVRLHRVPVFPVGAFPNDPARVPLKLDYLLADVTRIATAYGLPVRFADSAGTQWIRPHAAYAYADAQGRGEAFACVLFAARFSHGRDVGDDAVLGDAASAAELDPTALVQAADDPAVQQRVMTGMIGAKNAGVFGVPTFVYRGTRFWGNDRLEWLRRTIEQDLGQAVPDLTADPSAPPTRAA